MSISEMVSQSNKVLVASFLWFALWTVGSNVIAILELSSQFLIINLFLSIVGSTIFMARTSLDFSDFLYTSHSQEDRLFANKKAFLVMAALLVLMALLTSIFVYKYHFSWLYFFGGGIVLALGYSWAKRSKIVTTQSYFCKLPEKLLHLELLFLIILISALYYFGHQVDVDDANYVNLGLGAFRTEGGVFEFDTMIGDGGLPIHLPTYKSHSFELLVATLAYTLPGNTLLYMHVIVPIFFCVLFTLALFIINYSLFQSYWLLASVFQLVFVVFCIDSFPSLGAHGFFRFFQGKIEFIHIVIPLCILQVIKWNVYGKKEDLVFLFFLVVSSVGLTANAIYLAPLALGVAAMPFLFIKPFDKSNIIRLGATFFPAIYPVLVASVIIMIHGIYPSEFTEEVGQLDALVTYFGWNVFGMACVAILPILPFFMFEKKRAKYLYIYIGSIFFFFFNPLFWSTLSSVSGNLPGRVFWIVPFPILFSIPFVAILKLYNENLLNLDALHLKCITISVLFTIAAVGLRYQSLDLDRQVKIDWHLKPYRVNYADFEIAKFITNEFSPDCKVLLPEKIAQNLTMIENHPYPVAVRNLYLEHYRHTLDKDEIRLRWELMNSVSESSSYSISYENILLGIEKFGIDGILINEENVNFDLYQQAKANFKFDRQVSVGIYKLIYKDCY